MRTHARYIAAAASLFVLAATFGARADTSQLKGHVPFAFTVGEKSFAPGSCTVHRGNVGPGVLIIRNQKQAVILLTQGANPSRRMQDRPRLVFHRYGRQYFLREIWFASGSSSGNLLPETKAERAAASLANKSASLQSSVTVDLTLD
jgi:hypothetical protein